MAFGKRNIDKQLAGPSHVEGHLQPSASSWGHVGSSNQATLSRLLVLTVAGVVMLAAVSALFFMQPGRGEPIEVEAALIDGSLVSTQSKARVVDMCIEEGLMAVTRGEDNGDTHRRRITKACECTVDGVVGQLTPLQMQMAYVDYRTRLRATLSEIDRTGERVVIGQMPKLETREGAAIALVGAASFQSHWREARGVVSQQTARCQS